MRLAALAVAGALAGAQDPRPPYCTPHALVVSPDGATLYVSDRTAGVVALVDPAARRVRARVPVNGRPDGLALSADGARLYVAERGASSVAVIDTARGAVVSRLATDRWPVALAVGRASGRLYVCAEDTQQLTVYDLRDGAARALRRVPLVREPCAIVLTPDERRAVVANRLPAGRGTDPALSAAVSIVDTGPSGGAVHVRLPSGSSVVHGVATSPDGRWGYAVHGLGRFNLPMTQLERGWVNTFALTILDLERGEARATLLLDSLMKGAADPFSVVCSPDGRRLWISHAGVHEVSRVEIGALHALLEGKGSLVGPWERIRKDPQAVGDLANDLSALEVAGAIRRAPTGGKVPRGLALSPDGKSLFVANAYAGSVAVLDAEELSLRGTIPLGPQPEPDAVRRGEILFHDAGHAFQTWHSCATCHPNDARVDGLRWDFADDGLGNGMDTLNLRYIHETGRLHRLGTLADARTAAKHGLTFTHMLVPTEAQVDDLAAYLASLKAEPSPFLAPEGGLTESAGRGKALFEGKADCLRCHPGPFGTDRQFYNVGVVSEIEPEAKYKSTSLVELFRTAPYLHDGRALTLEEVFTRYNPKDEHGKTQGLTRRELEDLIAYLLSR